MQLSRPVRAVSLTGALAVAATFVGAVAIAPAAHANAVTVTPRAAQNTNATQTLTIGNVSLASTTSPGSTVVTVSGASVGESRNLTGVTSPGSGQLQGTLDTRMLAPGAYDVAVKPGGGATVDSCTGCFLVTASDPAPTSFTNGLSHDDHVGPNGSKVPFTVSGTSFADGDTVAVLAADGTVDGGFVFAYPTGTGVLSPTTITGTVTTGTNVAAGVRTLEVIHADGTPGKLVGGVTVDTPIANQKPDTPALAESTRHVIVVTGTGVRPGATVYQPSPGNGVDPFTVNGVTVTYDATTDVSTARVDVTAPAPSSVGPDANQTQRTYYLVNTTGSSSAALQLKIDPQPTITKITPSGTGTGTSKSYTITGTNFVVPTTTAPGTTFAVTDANGNPDPGARVTATTVTSTTSATVTIAVDAGGAARVDRVVATNPDYGTASVSLGITQAPTITSVSPSYIARGQTETVTIKGTGFQANSATTVTFPAGSGLTAGTPTVSSDGTSLTVSVTASPTAPAGNAPPSVNNPDGGTGTCADASCFVVNTYGVTDAGAAANTGTKTVTIVGSGFSDTNLGDYAVTFTPTKPGTYAQQTTITPTVTGRPDSSHLTVSVDLTGAAPEAYAVTVTNTSSGDTGRCDTCFSVTANLPAITSAAPSAVVPNEVGTITLTGHDYAHGFSLTSGTPADLQVTGATLSGTTGVTVSFSVPAGAKVGDDVTLTYTNTDGGKATTKIAIAQAPALVLTLPTGITAGGAAGDGSVEVQNPGGADLPNARVMLTFSGVAGTTASHLAVTANGARVALTTNSDGTFSGVLPATDVAAGSDVTTPLTFAYDQAGPHGTFVVHAVLQDVQGSGSTAMPTDTLASTDGTFALYTPATLAVHEPTQLQTGAAATAFSADVTNYSGTDDTVRIDVTLSGLTGLTPAQVTLTYGAAKTPVTLTAQSDGTLTGSVYGSAGTSLPDGTTSSVPLGLAIAAGAPTGTLTFASALTDVGSGKALATDSGKVRVYGAPSAPTNVAATTDKGTVTATFSAPATSGDASAVSSYTVTATAGSTTKTATGTGSPITVTGLTPGTTYAITVTATNADGLTGPASTPVSITAGAPGAPTNVAVTPGNGSLQVSFAAPTATGDSAGTLTYTVTATGGGATKTATGTTSPITVTGTTPGVAYSVTVTATNTDDGVTGPASAPAVSGTPYGPPGAPSAVMAKPGYQSAVVTFTPPTSDGGKTITGYTVTATPTTGSPVTASGTASPITLTGLTAGVTYAVTVTAANVAGTGPASTAVTLTGVSGPGSYVPVGPARVLDTRNGTGTVKGQIPANGKIVLQVTGVAGVPTSNVQAVLVNLVTTNAGGTGFVSANPTGTTTTTAELSAIAIKGQTLANLVLVPVGSGGTITLTSTVATDVVGDLSGYYLGTPGSAPTTDGAVAAITPTRVFDSRAGSGQLAAGTTTTLQVAGTSTSAVKGQASLVFVNVTSLAPNTIGYVTAYPSDQQRRTTSNQNVTGGQSLSTLMAVPVSADGRISLYQSAASGLVVDVVGYVVGRPGTASNAGGATVASGPTRVLDTRNNTGTTAGRLPAGGSVTVKVTNDPTHVAAVVMSVVATNTSAGGFLTVTPTKPAQLTTSVLNYAKAQTIANLVIVPVASDGTVTISTPLALDVVADVQGFELR